MMDALVFFTAAMAVSAVLFSYVGSEDGVGHAKNGAGSYADEVLSAFLRASLGSRVVIGQPYDCVLDGSEGIAECLVVEARLLDAGGPLAAFEELNGCLLSVLENLCGGHHSPHLLIFDAGGSSQEPVLAMPSLPGERDSLLAGNTLLPGDDNGQYVAVLVLDPALSAEVVQV